MNRSVSRLAVSFLVMFSVAACSANRAASDGPAKTKEEIRAEKIRAKEEAQARKYPPPPADSPLAKIKRDMGEAEVRSILGPPSTQQSHTSGKQWIPGYGAWAPDVNRVDFIYKGMGYVIFNQNRYSGKLHVLRVVYDPNR